MSRGQHVFVRRTGYSHHGVDVGNGEVVHFTGEPGRKAGAQIRRTSSEEFCRGGKVEIRVYQQCLPPDEVIAHAESKLGDAGYHLVFNNCEHFARWCVTGKHSSGQVNGAAAGTGTAAVTGGAAAGGVGVVAAGGVSGLSGPGIMSGLASIGPSGAVGGLITLGALPAMASVGIMQWSLRDDPALTPADRVARRIGRGASVAGAVAASVGGVASVSATGTAGLSGAGIASGLAAIGGSMAAGTAVVVAAPAVAAAGLGVGSYFVSKRIGARRAEAKANRELPPNEDAETDGTPADS